MKHLLFILISYIMIINSFANAHSDKFGYLAEVVKAKETICKWTSQYSRFYPKLGLRFVVERLKKGAAGSVISFSSKNRKSSKRDTFVVGMIRCSDEGKTRLHDNPMLPGGISGIPDEYGPFIVSCKLIKSSDKLYYKKNPKSCAYVTLFKHNKSIKLLSGTNNNHTYKSRDEVLEVDYDKLKSEYMASKK